MSGTYAELSGEELSQFQTFYRAQLASTLHKRTDAIEEAEELEFARDLLLAALNEGLTPGAAGEESYLKPDATDWTDPATLAATQAATAGKLPHFGRGQLAAKEMWQAAGALLAVLAILYWQFGPSNWSATEEVTPEATSEAGGRVTPTPIPTLESELLANIVDAAGVKTGLVAPRTLEIKGVSFVVQPVKITAGDWPPPDDERAASWVYGTVINYVMGLEATPANKQLIASLRAGDELLLRMSTGPAFHFAFVDAVRIAPQASELFRQARPGLTLALLEDGEQPDRAIVRAAYARARARIEKPSPVSFIQPGEKRVALGRFVDVPSFGGGLAEQVYPLQPLRRLLKLSGGEISPAPGQQAAAERAVGIKLLDARRHFHVVGPTGVGKSTMLLRMIWQYLADFPEAAVWLQEPHQDLTHKVVKRMPLWREKDVIWLDVMDPLRVLGINPLELPAGAEMGAVVANVMGIMRKAMGANWDTAVQMQEILENALLAVLAGQPRPTMVHLLKLLTNSDYRYDLTVNLNDPIAAPYWQSLEQKKEKELDAIFSVPRRRINAFVRNAVVRRIVAQPDSTVNFRQAIDSGKIILVQLDERMGGSNRAFIGAMMMYKLFGAIMSRMDIEEGERRQVAICVDEFQTFVGQSGPEFANILEQARKMGASLTLAHQHLGQLAEGDLVRSVANNTGTKIVFRAEASDAPQFLKWLPELKAIEDLTTLANYRCYVRPMVGGSPQPVCTLYTYADPPIPDPEAELRGSQRGEPEPLPPHPGKAALAELKRVQALASDEERRAALRALPEGDWPAYLAARRYDDAVRRNELIEHPEKLPDKLARVRELVRLGYGTPHYETEALVDSILR
ncbi:MAG: type IV secretion system DNA-binding domain-containing protein [Anaerolineales bacterium]|nr:type IV secretion system DNA-binding domain-containing protein [Anaerolineales bacterium]